MKIKVAILILMITCSIFAQKNNSSVKLDSKLKFSGMPFAFYSEEIKLVAGTLLTAENFLQKGATAKLAGLTTSNKTSVLYFNAVNIKVPYINRLIYEPKLFFSYYNSLYAYINDSYEDYALPYNEQPGHNDSSKDNYYEFSGQDIYLLNKFSYVLPFGHGKKYIKPHQIVKEGRIVEQFNGATSFNPFKSGRSKIELTPFYRKQKDVKNSGIELALIHENFDYFNNPTKGNRTSFKLIHDFGKLGSKVSWTNLEFDYRHYLQLNNDDYQPLVLATNFFTAVSPTWNEIENGELRRPASFAGANLGGNERFRAYYKARFNDRASIYYSAELRKVLAANPLKNSKFLDFFNMKIHFIQLVLFGETGRVAKNWEIEEMHSHLKGDAGFGLRLLMNDMLVRLDFAAGQEGTMVQMFIDQPF